MGNVVKGFGSGPVDSTVHTLEEGAALIVHICHSTGKAKVENADFSLSLIHI